MSELRSKATTRVFGVHLYLGVVRGIIRQDTSPNRLPAGFQASGISSIPASAGKCNLMYNHVCLNL